MRNIEEDKKPIPVSIGSYYHYNRATSLGDAQCTGVHYYPTI